MTPIYKFVLSDGYSVSHRDYARAMQSMVYEMVFQHQENGTLWKLTRDRDGNITEQEKIATFWIKP